MLRRTFPPVVITIVVMLSGLQALAQAAPGVFADATHPSGSPDPTRLATVWQVDPISGALTITIPFPTQPQGGRGPKVPFSLHYNSSSTVTLQTWGASVVAGIGSGIAGVVTVPQYTEYFQWSAGSFNTPVGPIGPWTTSGPFLTASSSQVPDQIFTVDQVTVNDGYGCNIYGPYLYTDENGATHDMNLELMNDPTSPMSAPCSSAYAASQQYGGTSAATDGSAFQTANLGIGSIGTFTLNGNSPSVIYPDGTQFYRPGLLEDANGNQATIGQDSPGRSFSTNIPIGQAGQIPIGTYTVTTTGATATGANLNEPYTITFSNVALGSFTMPHPNGSLEMHDLGYCISGYTCANDFAVKAGFGKNALSAITSITLPDTQSSYTFEYDPTYGTISKITFPTGGYVRFAWGIRSDGGGYGQFYNLSTLVVTDVYISAGSTENHWQYKIPSYSPTTGYTSTVYAPDGSYTSYTGACFLYSILNDFMSAQAPNCKEATRNTYSNGGKLIQSVATSYSTSGASTGLPTQIATTLYDGASPVQKQVQFKYDTWANVIEKDESDYYSCSGSPCSASAAPSNGWLRKTLTNYLWSSPNSTQPSYNYTQAHIVDKPSQVEVTDGAGNPVSMVQYNYDENTLSGSTGIMNHDDENFPATKNGPRGNLTTEKHCISFSGANCGQWNAAAVYNYDLAGMLVSEKDPNGNQTAFDYTDSYSGYTPSKPTDAYPKTVTRPTVNSVAHVDKYSYFFQNGEVATHLDENSQTTQYAYNDSLNRLKAITLPSTVDGTTGSSGQGNTKFTYNDSPGNWYMEKQVLQNLNSAQITTTEYYDGLGRPSSAVLADPIGSITVTKAYDPNGRLYQVSNPFRTSSDSTYGATTYFYDALDRKVCQVDPDNSATPLSTCSQNTIYQQWTYSGNKVTFRDEDGNQWQRANDGLDRLTQVLEPTGSSQSPSMETDYAYSANDNLLSITQKGDGSGNRNRSFGYDGLSRLLAANNPENASTANPPSLTCSGVTGGPWTTCYGYDANGNPTSKIDNRNITITYSYDALNRLIGKSYSDGVTGPALFGYDTEALLMGTTHLTTTNAHDRPSWTCMENVAKNACLTMTAFSYDGTGKTLNTWVQLDPSIQPGSVPVALTYTYDLSGGLTSQTNGSPTQPITLARRYDIAGRLASITSNWTPDANHPATLFQANSTNPSSPAYGPFGLMNASLGIPSGSQTPAVTLARSYDKRGRTISETDIASKVQTAVPVASTGSISIGSPSNGDQSRQINVVPAAGGTATITINGGPAGYQNCQPGPYCQNPGIQTGTITITVNGAATSVNYGPGTTSQQLASSFATSIGGSVFTTSVNGSSFTITAKATGSGTNYPLSYSQTNQYGQVFTISGPSSLTGGTNGSPGTTVYDSGSVTATINGCSGHYNWGKSDSTTSIASGLSQSLSSACNSFLSVGSSGFLVSLTSKQTGSATNWPISVSVSYDSTDFSSASFTATQSGMGGGANPGYNQETAYSYAIPSSGGYDGVGNLKSVNDSVTGIWNYSYDTLNRLSTGSPASGVYAGRYGCWTYDGFGNRTLEAVSTTACNSSPGGNWAHFNALNQITGSSQMPGGYGYDAAGNVTDDGINQYLYDGEGRVCATRNKTTGGMTQYVYDPDGHRVAKGTISSFTCNLSSSGFSITNVYVVDLNGEQLTETNGTGGWMHTNVFANNNLLATYGGADTYFALNDWLGTKRVETSAGGCLSTWLSLPFGNALQATGNCQDATEHHFTGKQRDQESGNDYFLARYYSSSMGRFMSPDWSDQEKGGDPVPYADLENPQSLNLYGYVRNNPLKGVDKDGHDGPDTAILEGAAGLSAVAPEAAPVIFGIAGGIILGKAISENWDAIGEFVSKAAANGTTSPGPYVGPILDSQGSPTGPLLNKNANGQGGEPPQLKAGKEAHNNEEVRPGEEPEVRTASGKGRMDRYDAEKGHIREIKPNNVRGRKSGKRQLDRYKADQEQATRKPHTTELTLYPPKN